MIRNTPQIAVRMLEGSNVVKYAPKTTPGTSRISYNKPSFKSTLLCLMYPNVAETVVPVIATRLIAIAFCAGS